MKCVGRPSEWWGAIFTASIAAAEKSAKYSDIFLSEDHRGNCFWRLFIYNLPLDVPYGIIHIMFNRCTIRSYCILTISSPRQLVEGWGRRHYDYYRQCSIGNNSTVVADIWPTTDLYFGLRLSAYIGSIKPNLVIHLRSFGYSIRCISD